MSVTTIRNLLVGSGVVVFVLLLPLSYVILRDLWKTRIAPKYFSKKIICCCDNSSEYIARLNELVRDPCVYQSTCVCDKEPFNTVIVTFLIARRKEKDFCKKLKAIGTMEVI